MEVESERGFVFSWSSDVPENEHITLKKENAVNSRRWVFI